MNEIESNSIDRFRQFKKGIRGSKEHLIVGLDIAKRKHHGFLGDANGRTLLKGLIVENSAEVPPGLRPAALKNNWNRAEIQWVPWLFRYDFHGLGVSFESVF
jgi:hypothetical protein